MYRILIVYLVRTFLRFRKILLKLTVKLFTNFYAKYVTALFQRVGRFGSVLDSVLRLFIFKKECWSAQTYESFALAISALSPLNELVRW